MVINENVIKIILWREVEHPNIVKWSLVSINIPSECKHENNKIFEILREAMKTYRMSGFQFYDEGFIETIIKF